MKYIHKVGFIQTLPNHNIRSSVVTFKSNCDQYKHSVLSFVNHNPEYQSLYLYEPVTRSPITFDLTLSIMGNSKPFNCDRYFLTFNELKKYCDSISDNESIISILTQPFCRVLFSRAGKLGAFLEGNQTGYKLSKTPYKSDSNIVCNVGHESFNKSVFNEIANGIYNHEI